MALAAILETKRLESVQHGELLSIVWQLPQYIFIAGAECFGFITQLEFFHGQAPDSMKSILTSFAYLTLALGNYLNSAMITVVTRVTRAWHSPGWIPDDLNEGHLDYFYWCFAAISFHLHRILPRRGGHQALLHPAASHLPGGYFSLHFSDVRPTTALLAETLSLSPPPPRAPPPTSSASSSAARSTLPTAHSPSSSAISPAAVTSPPSAPLLQEFPSALGPDTLKAYLFHLARAGRATDALKVFDELPEQLRTVRRSLPWCPPSPLRDSHSLQSVL
ncbi:hypothetical protein ACQ4PT_006274 [Festuca glaucescens]